MSSNYKKPYLTFHEQLDLLKSRGMEIADEDRAISYLDKTGYYRLSAYWYSLRNLVLDQDGRTGAITTTRDDTFYPGSTFQNVLDLYVFDKRLRLLVMDAIERIEVSIRVDVAYLLGGKDTFAHTKPSLLHGNFTKKIQPKSGKTAYTEWMEKYDKVLSRSKEDFVRHFRQKYGLPLPIWVSIELWEFGMLSKFYQGMSVADKRAVALKYGISDGSILETWLRSLNFVRNVAAHHSRLFNKNLVDQPKLPKQGEIPKFDHLLGNQEALSRIYVVLCILVYLMRTVSPNSTWFKRLHHLIKAYPTAPRMSLSDMGFPVDWEEHLFS